MAHCHHIWEAQAKGVAVTTLVSTHKALHTAEGARGKRRGGGGVAMSMKHIDYQGMPLELEHGCDGRGLRVVLSKIDEHLHKLGWTLCRDTEVTIGVHTQKLGGCPWITYCQHLLHVVGHSMRVDGGHGGVNAANKG